jgi:AraC family transcriptional regulator
MLWSELYDNGHEPSDNQIKEFVGTPLWDDLVGFLQQAYNVKPKLFYSNCSMDQGLWKGWNVKYKKNGKALCTLYPKQDFFMALIAVSANEIDEADLLIQFCDQYTQDLYCRTGFGYNGKSLALEITNEIILRDAKELIALRVMPRK